MVMVIAGGIFSVTHVDFIICTFFTFLTGNISFALLCYNVVDKSFFGFEVVTHDFRFVRRFAIFENRQSCFYTGSVCHASGIYRTAIHIHRYDSRSKFDILVCYFSLTIQMGISFFCEYDGVGSFVYYRRVERFFLFIVRRI